MMSAFIALELGEFPVFFPVSREFSRREVSARLRPPPCSLGCREIRLLCQENRKKSPQFLNFCSQTGPEKVSLSTLHRAFAPFFSAGQMRSPVSATPFGECQAITNR